MHIRLGAVALFVTACGFAQQSQPWDFLSAIGEYRNVRGMLKEYLDAQAFRLLDQREAHIAAISNAQELAQRKAYYRERMLHALGGLPERTPLNPRVVGTLERPGYRIEKIIFESQPRFFVTANLYVPTSGAPPYPAILFPLGHEPGAKAYPVWQQVLGSLAQKGFVLLTWDPLGQGERKQFYDPDWQDSKLRASTTEHTMLGIQCLLAGDHIARYTVWDGIRALDYLLSRKEVDASRVGCTGNSGGGTHTTYISSLDDRIQAAAPSCYISSWRRMLESLGPQDAEQVFPSWLKDGLDYPDFLYGYGPKPFLILSAIRDFFPIDGARATFAEASRVFARAGFPDRVHFFNADDGHGYTKPRRMQAYPFFARWLKHEKDEEPEPTVRISTEGELQCTETGQVSTSLGGEDVFSLNRKRVEQFKPERPALSTAADVERVRAQVLKVSRELSAFQPASGAPPVRPYGTVEEPGYRVEKLVFESEPGVPVPSVLLIPAGASKRPAIVYADGDGKSASHTDLEALVKAGFVVLAMDLRGLGETRPAGLTRGGDFAHFFGDYDNAMTALLIGRPLVGMRAQDIALGVNLLVSRPEVDASRIYGFGRGLAAVPMLYAAAFDNRIQRLALENMLISYESVVDQRIHRNIFESVVPAALRHYDLPDLLMAIAPRPVWLIGAAGPLGHERPVAEVRKKYAAALDAFRLTGKTADLHIATRREADSFQTVYGQMLENQAAN